MADSRLAQGSTIGAKQQPGILPIVPQSGNSGSRSGEVIELEVERIGVLRNRVVASHMMT